MKRHRAIAQHTLDMLERKATAKKARASASVHIRMTPEDVQALHERAATLGIGYQTLLKSVVHQYLTGAARARSHGSALGCSMSCGINGIFTGVGFLLRLPWLCSTPCGINGIFTTVAGQIAHPAGLVRVKHQAHGGQTSAAHHRKSAT